MKNIIKSVLKEYVESFDGITDDVLMDYVKNFGQTNHYDEEYESIKGFG